MQMRHLQCFMAVAEELHFSRAAKRLHLSQPPLSKHVRQLEQELGVQLFHRNRHSVSLTEAGKVYRGHIQNVFLQLDQGQVAAQRAQAGQTGELRIGFLSALFYDFVPPLLLRYRERFPQVQVSMVEMVPAEQIEALRSGRIDVAFPGLAPKSLFSGLNSRALRIDPWFACFHTGHPLARKKQVWLRELKTESFVLVQRPVSPAFNDAILELCRLSGFTPRVVQTAARAQTLLSLIAAGIGMSLFPEAITKLPIAGLVFIPLRDKLPPFEHSIVWSPSNASTVLAEFLREQAAFFAG